ncbi:formyltransferase [Actimicrobium sp. CCI2.3]|uniref:formyltransferase n=1 Tax=Actimicrobium sp. CCI2.3 TaxID=3048616 RepID=UPI002AB3C730|nr:formyltransferase [Actimicrobium sp. CCI2.3]MDY7572947.1 formyltransferase [Actimicrobium sp. CCI2.3]MEB0020792.1 formyltransferase [Actimicrobium sp. CCI2.3]
MRAVVFAYHNVGVRCLQVLLARGVEIALVVTHQDNPAETIWFESVAALCAEHGIPVTMPNDPASPALLEQVRAIAPDFIFSFYYRHMLPVPLLALARTGAFNMHGSLLPKYRGRVPINWAVLHGEDHTGATLHEMAAKPDAGAIVAQTSVPILPDDTAYEVFGKVVVAAEKTLWDVLPAMLAGRIPRLPNDIAQGSYFGGRTPADGRIDWQQSAQQVYNLHRAVAPPYPGAWTMLDGVTCVIGKARLSTQTFAGLPPGLAVVDNRMLGICGDARALEISTLLVDDVPLTPAQLQQHLSGETH